MCAHQVAAKPSRAARAAAALTWLGGGDWRELGERHERSTHVVTGVVVLLNAALAWLIATLVVAGSTGWSVAAVAPLTLLFGVLVGAITRTIASGTARGWRAVFGRGVVALVVGVVVGELAAMVLFSGSIDRRLDDQAAVAASSVPAVQQASLALDHTRAERAVLDAAVEAARARRDEALVTARCEYNPSPACPETRITGVPGQGPETRTANELLAGAQREMDTAVAARDTRAAELNARVSAEEQALAQARQSAIAQADRGFGARWVALNGVTLSHAGALVLRVLTVAFFALLSLLPLILRLWRGETTADRSATARAERARAETEADTAIAVKRAEVRAAAETMWADQQLTNARLAVEAQNEIDRAHHRNRIEAGHTVSTPIESQRLPEPVEEDMYLPIAAEAEAASVAAAQLPPALADAPVDEHLPARIDSDEPRPEPAAAAIPTIPDVTKAAARWIRPLVPSFVARAIDTTAHPLRAARQAFEEVEEITFTLKRTRKVTFDSEESERRAEPAGVEPPARPRRVESSIAGREAGHRDIDGRDTGVAGQLTAHHLHRNEIEARADLASLGQADVERERELAGRDLPRQLRGPQGPRELPPAP